MISEDVKFLKTLCIKCRHSVKYFFKYKPKYRKYIDNKILVAGGYGYGNVGDEAQCSATLRLLSERYKQYRIINLTPNIIYSKQQHPDFEHDYASRVLVYNAGRDYNIFNFENSNLKKILFLVRSMWMIFNARLIRAGMPTICLNADCAKFLYELKTAKLFFFCGGGFLTGPTLSRLWDGIMICRCCFLLRTPVVMSGQTIGIWNTPFNKFYAKYGFRHVKLITVRDFGFSLKDLAMIGISGENVFATHDDALFCDKSKEKQIDLTSYLTLNFHYWGTRNQKDREQLLKKINMIVSHIINSTSYYIVFIPMVKSDKQCFDDYIAKYPEPRFTCFNYDYDFRKVRRVISDSKACITMKHHPIIFAMGEDIPAISLNLFKYYEHKNIGALAQYGMEGFSLNLDDAEFLKYFSEMFNQIETDYASICLKIKNSMLQLVEQKKIFLEKIDLILRR